MTPDMNKRTRTSLLAFLLLMMACSAGAQSRPTLATDGAVRGQQIRLIQSEVIRLDKATFELEKTDDLRDKLSRSKDYQLCRLRDDEKACRTVAAKLEKIMTRLNCALQKMKADMRFARFSEALRPAQNYLAFRRAYVAAQASEAERLSGLESASRGVETSDDVDTLIHSLKKESTSLLSIFSREKGDLSYLMQMI